jgi:hypothetical protein
MHREWVGARFCRDNTSLTTDKKACAPKLGLPDPEEAKEPQTGGVFRLILRSAQLRFTGTLPDVSSRAPPNCRIGFRRTWLIALRTVDSNAVGKE